MPTGAAVEAVVAMVPHRPEAVKGGVAQRHLAGIAHEEIKPHGNDGV